MKFFYPFTVTRQFADLTNGLIDMFSKVLESRKLTVYTSWAIAWAEANSMVCDDETCSVLVIDTSRGFVRVYDDAGGSYYQILPNQILNYLDVKEG